MRNGWYNCVWNGMEWYGMACRPDPVGIFQSVGRVHHRRCHNICYGSTIKTYFGQMVFNNISN